MAFSSLTKTVHHSAYPAIDPSNPAISALGKTVIVSGGACGIGYAIARGFAVAGADTIVILARRQEALDEASERIGAEITTAKGTANVWTYHLNITNSNAASPVFEDIRRRLNEGTSSQHVRYADVLVTSAASL
jgi:NAD(P)-dependent dehydrogenase (short-subunit alcohol dehydrogenase family)